MTTLPYLRGFAGDEEKSATLQALIAGGVPTDTSFDHISAVVEQLDSLPAKALPLVFNHWAASADTNGSRTKWFDALFRWCFAASSAAASEGPADRTVARDESGPKTQLEFVGLFIGDASQVDELQLNSHRFHILRTIVSCSVRLGAQGVDFLHRYLKSTSQRFRKSFLLKMCKSEHLSNDALFDIVATMPLSTRKAVFVQVACKHRSLRLPFIERSLVEDPPLSQLVLRQHRTKASSQFLKEHYIDRSDFVFSDWTLHGELYVQWVHDYVRDHDLETDPLALGAFFTNFLRRIRVNRRDEFELAARLLLRYRPRVMLPTVKGIARKELTRLSAARKLDAKQFADNSTGFLQFCFDGVFFSSLPTPAALSILHDHWMTPADGSQPYFQKDAAQFCGWILQQVQQHPDRCGRVGKAAVAMAVQVFGTVSRDDFWAHLTGKADEHSIPTPQYETFTLFAKLCHRLVTAKRPSTSSTFALLEAWQSLHLRLKPEIPSSLKILGERGRDIALEMLQTWHGSLIGAASAALKVSAERFRYKSWIAKANPERGGAAQLWDRMRNFTANIVLSSCPVVNELVSKVSDVFTAQEAKTAGPSSIAPQCSKLHFFIASQTIVTSVHRAIVDAQAAGIAAFGVDAAVANKILNSDLKAAEDAVAKFLETSLGPLVDFPNVDPRWFSHQERLDNLERVLAEVKHSFVSTRLADQLATVYEQELEHIQKMDVRFALAQVGNGTQQVLVRVGKKTLQRAHKLLVDAVHELLIGMVDQLEVYQDEAHLARIRKLYVLHSRHLLGETAEHVGFGAREELNLSEALRGKKSSFRMGDFLDRLQEMPVFLQREEAVKRVIPILEYLVAHKGKMRSVVDRSPFVVRVEYVIPFLLERVSNIQPGDKTLNVDLDFLHKRASVTSKQSLQYRLKTSSHGQAGITEYICILDACMQQERASPLAHALTVVAKRIRNESGLVRPALYQYLQDNVRTMLALTLPTTAILDGERPLSLDRRRSDDPTSSDSSDFDLKSLKDAATATVDALSTMLRDDMSKSDTVAKGSFQRLAAAVLERILRSPIPSTPEYIDIVNVWIQFSMQVHWDLAKRFKGVDGLRLFRPPPINIAEDTAVILDPDRGAQFKAHVASWLAQTTRVTDIALAFHATDIFSSLASHQHHNKQAFARLATTVLPVPEKISLVTDCVADVAGVAVAAWQQAQATPTNVPAWLVQAAKRGTFLSGWDRERFFPRDKQKLFVRVQWLIAALQCNWPSSPDVRTVLEVAEQGLMSENCPSHHVEQCLELVSSLFETSSASTKYLLRPIILGLLRACVRQFDAARTWEAKVDSGLSATARRLVHFLQQQEGTSFSKLKNRAQPGPRVADAALLFKLSSSAVHLRYVQKFLLGVRTDLVADIIVDPTAKYAGIFSPNLNKEGSSGSESDLPNFRFQPDIVSRSKSNFCAKLQAMFASLDMFDLQDPNVGLDRKGVHMSRYLSSPSTGLAEHVALMESMKARLRANPDDTSASFLLERVVLAAYDSDQKVWLLAHLLSPRSVQTNHHRDTIKVIDRLRTEFSADAVVGVLRLLLSAGRRGAMKVALHKMIVRTLADLEHEEAGDILLDEWQLAFLPKASGGLHKDVVLEIVMQAVSKVLAHNAERNAMLPALWTIVESLAGSTQTTPDADVSKLPVAAVLTLLAFRPSVNATVAHNADSASRINQMQTAHQSFYELTKDFNSCITKYRTDINDPATAELWNQFSLQPYGRHLDLNSEYHFASTWPRLLDVLIRLAEAYANLLQEKREPLYQVQLVFVTLRLLQCASLGAATVSDEFAARVMALTDVAVFDAEASTLLSLDEEAWSVTAERHNVLQLTAIVRQYAHFIVSRLDSMVLERVPEGKNKPKLYTQTVQEISSSSNLAANFRAKYGAQVQALLSLSLSSPLERRKASQLRSSLRGGLLDFHEWEQELCVLPNIDAERLLRLENANNF